MDEIINLDDMRKKKEAEEADAIEHERAYLRRTLKIVLQQIAALEERADRLCNRESIRETRREPDNESLSDSWFARTFSFSRKKRDDD